MGAPNPDALFNPTTFARIAEGYDLAYRALKKREIALSEHEREALAARVIDLALLGEQNPQRLCDAVIAELWPQD